MKHVIRTLIILILTGLVAGCVTLDNKRGETQKQYITFSYAPNIQYLMSFGSQDDLVPPSNFRKLIVGTRNVAKENKTIFKPYGIAVTSGKVYISDGRFASGYWVLDLMTKKLELIQHNALKESINIALDNSGYKFFTVPQLAKAKAEGLLGTKEEKGSIVVFDNKDNFIKEMDFPGRPIGITILDENIFVTDGVNQRIVVINKNTFQITGEFGKAGEGEGEFRIPKDITAGQNGLLYVSDVYNGRIQVFKSSGEFVSQYGRYSGLLGCFLGIEGIAVTRDEKVFVVDSKFRDKKSKDEIQVFDSMHFYGKGERVYDLSTPLDKRKKAFCGYFQKPYAAKNAMYMPLDICIDYENVQYFQQYAAPGFKIEYLIWLTSQYISGGKNITVFAYGHLAR